MPQVQIVLGSASDLKSIQSSGMVKILEATGISHSVSVCSAHRNLPELDKFTAEAVAGGAEVLIGVAGLAAALPGALAGLTGMAKPVIGVALDEHGIDSCLYMPPGVPVLLAGVGNVGLKNAALAAVQIIAVGDETVAQKLGRYITETKKTPQFNVNLAEAQ